MASSLNCMLLLSTPANVDRHSVISDWLDTISLKNMLSDIKIITLTLNSPVCCSLQKIEQFIVPSVGL